MSSWVWVDDTVASLGPIIKDLIGEAQSAEALHPPGASGRAKRRWLDHPPQAAKALAAEAGIAVNLCAASTGQAYLAE